MSVLEQREGHLSYHLETDEKLMVKELPSFLMWLKEKEVFAAFTFNHDQYVWISIAGFVSVLLLLQLVSYGKKQVKSNGNSKVLIGAGMGNGEMP